MGKKLYVGNLPFSTNESSLEQIFAQAGAVESIKIITDRDTGRSKGFGFVEMPNDSEAESAIAKFNGADYEGRTIVVSEARPMVPRENRRSSGFGGGRGGNGNGNSYGNRRGARW